jgi:hypothetical protein
MIIWDASLFIRIVSVERGEESVKNKDGIEQIALTRKYFFLLE